VSQQNVEIVLASIDGYNAGDIDAQMATYLPTAVAITHLSGETQLPDADHRLEGRAAIRRLVAQTRESWRARYEPSHVQALSDGTVLCSGRCVGVATGIELYVDTTVLFRFRDGLIECVEFFDDHADALRALGLEEAAMSQETVEVAEAFYSALAREDDEGVLDLLDPAIEYVNPDGAIEPGVRKGIDEYFAVLETMQEGWAYWRMYPERFVPIADKVAVVYRYEAKARSSGVRLEGRESARLTLRRGKIVRYEWFHAPEDALKAAELEE
jgi:ketosteroid isomerase-like protein